MTITSLMMMKYVLSSPILNCYQTTLTLDKSRFVKSISPFMKSLPINANVISSYFVQFLTTPFRLQENPNCLVETNSDTNHSYLENDCIHIEQIKFFDFPNITFSNTIFQNCSAILGSKIDEISGGSVFAYGALNVVFDRCQFLNSLSLNAGAINLCNCKTNITNCVFYECCALQNIGCIWSMGFLKNQNDCNLSIVETNFTNNIAGKYCGAINANMTNSVLKSCIFQNNRANKSVGAVALIDKHISSLNFVEFIGNACLEECAALWIQGSNDYMDNIHRISLDTISFSNNVILNNEMTKNAIRVYGIVALYYNNQICFDGSIEEFITIDDNFVLGQYFREVLFRNDTLCLHKMTDTKSIECPEYTNPYITNTFIKDKIPLYMPIELM